MYWVIIVHISSYLPSTPDRSRSRDQNVTFSVGRGFEQPSSCHGDLYLTLEVTPGLKFELSDLNNPCCHVSLSIYELVFDKVSMMLVTVPPPSSLWFCQYHPVTRSTPRGSLLKTRLWGHWDYLTNAPCSSCRWRSRQVGRQWGSWKKENEEGRISYKW